MDANAWLKAQAGDMDRGLWQPPTRTVRLDTVSGYALAWLSPIGTEGRGWYQKDAYAGVWLIVAALLIVSSWLLLNRSQLARWVGFVAATIGALPATTRMPYCPIWSMTYVAMFVLTFNALAIHGGRN